MACDEIGAYQGPKEDFVATVVNLDSDGSCQAEQVGRTSPGPIQSEETLGRFVFSPTHLTSKEPHVLDETIVDDAFKFGASVNRLTSENKESIDALHLKGEAIAEDIRTGAGGRQPKPERRYLGLLRFAAKDVRGVKFFAQDAQGTNVEFGPPCARVYDTSLDHDALHGDIVADTTPRDGVKEKAIRKGLRTKLFLEITGPAHCGIFVSPHDSGDVDASLFGVTILADPE